MEYGHLVLSITNIAGFALLGIAWAYILKKEWKKLKYISANKFAYIGGIAGTIGGLIGFLVNGIPETGVSITNMEIASLFAILSIVLYSQLTFKEHGQTNFKLPI